MRRSASRSASGSASSTTRSAPYPGAWSYGRTDSRRGGPDVRAGGRRVPQCGRLRGRLPLPRLLRVRRPGPRALDPRRDGARVPHRDGPADLLAAVESPRGGPRRELAPDGAGPDRGVLPDPGARVLAGRDDRPPRRRRRDARPETAHRRRPPHRREPVVGAAAPLRRAARPPPAHGLPPDRRPDRAGAVLRGAGRRRAGAWCPRRCWTAAPSSWITGRAASRPTRTEPPGRERDCARCGARWSSADPG